MLERERSHAALAHESEARAREAAEARAEAQVGYSQLTETLCYQLIARVILRGYGLGLTSAT